MIVKKKKINSKKKGSNNERECCVILNEKFGGGFMRIPQSGAIFGGANKYRAEGMDISKKENFSGDIACPPFFRYSIEHKAYKDIGFFDLFNKSSNLNAWLEQCQGDADFVNKSPMLIVKINGRKRIIAIKDKIDNYTFEKDKWYFYWMEELLLLDREFFFNKETKE